jgi:hypothetical protein
MVYPLGAKHAVDSQLAIQNRCRPHRGWLDMPAVHPVGVSFDYSFIERFSFGSNLPGESGFDEQLELNVHFTF